MSTALLDMAAHAGMQPNEVAYVRQLPLLRGLEDAEVAGLLQSAIVRDHERNHLLFSQGDKADRFYVVLSGWVRLFRSTPDGNEVTINLFTEGESLAEAALLADGNFPVSGMTADDSRLLTVPASGFMRHLSDNPRLCFNMMAGMARRLQVFVRQIEQLSHRSTTERLAAFILRLAPAAQGACTIRLPIDKSLIAARLGMQPETFSRSLAKLRRYGVQSIGNEIRLDEVGALRALLREDEERA